MKKKFFIIGILLLAFRLEAKVDCYAQYEKNESGAWDRRNYNVGLCTGANYSVATSCSEWADGIYNYSMAQFVITLNNCVNAG
jgi:hypothetical protein